MALGANFATVNHLLINALVLEAFQEIIPGVKGSLVYFISHNIARKELLPDGRGGFAGEGWVHRKGATRAFRTPRSDSRRLRGRFGGRQRPGPAAAHHASH